MTIRELRKLIKGIPANVKVVIGMGESLEDICPISSKPIMVEFNDNGDKELLFVLSECTCEDEEFEIPLGEVNSQPELN